MGSQAGGPMAQLPFQTNNAPEQRRQQQARKRRAQYNSELITQQKDSLVNRVHERNRPAFAL
jgi:hypothetical protein